MIQTEKEYQALVNRIEKLLENPDNIKNTESADYLELNVLSELVADYEERNYPVSKPNL